MRSHLALFVVVFVFLSSNLSGDIPVIRLSNDLESVNFSNRDLASLIDESKEIDISDIIGGRYELISEKGNEIYPYGSGVIWLAFKLAKDEDEVFRDYLIQFSNAHIAFYELYIYDGEDLVGKKIQGDNFNYDQREVRHNFFVHNLPDIDGNELTLFVRIDQEGQEINFPINIFQRDYFIQHTLRVKMFHGVALGLFLITTLATLFLFVVYNHKYFLYEVIVSVASIMYIISEEGYGLMLLWQNSPDINDYSRPFFMGVIVVFSLLFTIDYLKVYSYKIVRYGYVLIAVLIVFGLTVVPLDLFGLINEQNIGVFTIIYILLLILCCTVTVVIAYLSWHRERNQDSLVLLLLFTVTLIAVVIRFMAIEGWTISTDLVRHTGFITRAIHIPLIGGYIIYQAIRNFRENQEARIQLLLEKGNLTKSLIENRDAERKRISMALHDSAGSIITGIKANLQMVLDNNVAIQGDRHYNETIHLTDQLQQEIRNISNHLLPSSITKLGLAMEIKRILSIIETTHKIETSFETNIEGKSSLSEHVIFHLYYIIREALDNIIKYAEAAHILIQFFIYDDSINLLIEDDGKGFQVIEAKKKGGHGLKNMELRVNWLNGMIDIYSKEGTSLTINVPIKSSESAA